MKSTQLKKIVEEIGADSAAIMAPNVTEGCLFCYESFDMPQEWVEIKNPLDEQRPGGNVQVYTTGTPSISNHIRVMFHGYLIDSVMIVPVYRDGNIIATLELIRDEDNRAFTKEDMENALEFAKEIQIL